MLHLRAAARRPAPSPVTLTRLDREWATLTDAHLGRLRRRARTRAGVYRTALDAIVAMDAARTGVHALLAVDQRERLVGLETLRARLLEDLARAPADARVLLARALVALDLTMAELHEPTPTCERSCVTLPTSLVRAVCLQLMPPERMAVVAGTVTVRQMRATAVFDVTAVDTASAVHVRADARKLAEALTAMDATGTRLLAWVHSHPGVGAGATAPSHIDTRQYAEWIRDFPQLVAAIATQDRCLRFFGEVVEQDRVHVHLDGPGVQQVEAHVYRLA